MYELTRCRADNARLLTENRNYRIKVEVAGSVVAEADREIERWVTTAKVMTFVGVVNGILLGYTLVFL